MPAPVVHTRARDLPNDQKYRILPHPEGEGDEAVVVFKGTAYQQGFLNEAEAQAWVAEQPNEE